MDNMPGCGEYSRCQPIDYSDEVFTIGVFSSKKLVARAALQYEERNPTQWLSLNYNWYYVDSRRIDENPDTTKKMNQCLIGNDTTDSNYNDNWEGGISDIVRWL